MDRKSLRKATSKRSGVYIIWSEKYCLYVGASTSMWNRIVVCLKKKWDFKNRVQDWMIQLFNLKVERVEYHYFEIAELSKMERYYYDKYRPILNRVKPGSSFFKTRLDKCNSCDILSS